LKLFLLLWRLFLIKLSLSLSLSNKALSLSLSLSLHRGGGGPPAKRLVTVQRMVFGCMLENQKKNSGPGRLVQRMLENPKKKMKCFGVSQNEDF